MDILAARKKAAERAREQKAAEPATPVRNEAAEQAPVHEQAVPAPARDEAPGEGSAGQLPETAAPAPDQPVPVPAGPEPAAAPEPEAAQDLEMLCFRLGSEEYAVLVEDVKEVLKNRELTPVPNAPAHVLGVTSLRGPILPVVDLHKRLGLRAGERDDKTRILVVTLNDEDTGIIVDRVTGVVRIPPDAVRPAPETLEHGAEYLKGIARKDDRLYILLDIDKVLAG